MKQFNFKRYKRYKFFLIYVIGFIVSTTAIYITIPVFFNYENSKNNIENKIYKEFNIKSSIKGKIKYRPLPTPRLKINNLVVKDLLDDKINLGEVENVILKIPFKKVISLNKKPPEIKCEQGSIIIKKMTPSLKLKIGDYL